MKSIFFQPFEKYSEKLLLSVGLLLTLVGSFVAAAFNVRFDGVLDAHIVSELTFYKALIDNVFNIACLVFFLFLSAKYINLKTRFIDVLSTVIIARIPLYILPLSNFNGALGEATGELIQVEEFQTVGAIPMQTWVYIILFSILALLLIIWSVALLFNGFKVASNAKGGIHIILFILSLVLAEILSKFLIFQFNF